GSLGGITRGPDGNVWFAVDNFNPSGPDRIGRITPEGAITLFSAGITPDSGPVGITTGSDGNLWFTELAGQRIGRITTAGVVTEFAAGLTPGSDPGFIASGADGSLWFTEVFGNRIGRLDPPLNAAGTAVHAAAGTLFTASLATFTDADLTALPSNF